MDEPQSPQDARHGNHESRERQARQGLAHRRQRRQVRTALASGVAEVITRRKAGDVWSFAKDGKSRFDPTQFPS